MPERDIKSLYPEELAIAFKEMGEPSYRAAQVFDWLHRGIHSFDEMTNISKALRQKLADNYDIRNVSIEKKLESGIDDTVKYLYKMSHDGEFVESVLMRYHYGDTVCVSTQVGCRMACRFCASGQNGLTRSL
ncbi:MAG: 23S rRNA (adenine(2503)-C(2))-methyltransferase RlmN, partial [Clostridia bacterium]|nr:23S rRNA (adenine(2503)-C(2))-methyltransferase RlmN [Clostridia bacterium]